MSKPFDDACAAPLFQLYWENSTLNDSRSVMLAERIARDNALPEITSQPLYAQAAQPLPKSSSKLEKIWRARKSSDAFSNQPLDERSVSRLLSPLAAHSDGRRLLPSAGAKYPLLVYVAFYAVRGMNALNGKLAWYNPGAHGLAPFASCPDWVQMQTILGTAWPHPPALIVFVVAEGNAMLEKYGERGGRFILLEAGAYMGALALQAAEEHLAGILLGSFHDQKVLDLLRLDRQNHLVTFAYACGKMR